MALEDILKALEEEGENECRRIKEEAEAKAKTIVEEAKKKAKAFKEKEVEKAKVKASSDGARLINAARLRAKREIVYAKERILQRVKEEAKKKLISQREDKNYPEVLAKMIAESLDGITSDNVIVRVNTRDKELAEKLLRDYQVKAKVETDKGILGGLIVQSEDGRVTVTNTLESRLERAYELLKSEVIDLIFKESNA
jgi:V/A-type H+-transporting ATPase subunit E